MTQVRSADHGSRSTRAADVIGAIVPVAGGAWGGGGGPSNPQDLNRYSYALNNPVRFTDPTGHFLDTLLDVGFIAYGVYDIAANGYTHERGISLAADVIGAIIPGVTGLGAAVRVANRADDAIDAARAAQLAADARKADEARRAAEAGEKAEEAARKAADAQKAEAARRTAAVSAHCSFSPDTPVLTPDGSVPIGAVTVGAEVLAYHEASDTLGVYPVVAVWSHRDPIRVTLTLDGETIATTSEYPFRVVKAVLSADDAIESVCRPDLAPADPRYAALWQILTIADGVVFHGATLFDATLETLG